MTADESSIPIVDFSRWAKASSEEKKEIAKELTDACIRVGFVYIVNHGVPDEMLDEAFGWSQKFFALPEEKKMLAPHPAGPNVHRGYSWPGLEKVSQYIHKDEDGDADAKDEELRKVGDVKVCTDLPFPTTPLPLLTRIRKATKSAATSAPTSQMSGYPKKSFLVSAHS